MSYYVCEYCGIQYKLKKVWYEHELICKLIHDTTNRTHTQEDEDDQQQQEPTTTKELYVLIKYLTKKQAKMEQEIETLRRSIKIQHALNPQQWLTSHIVPLINYYYLLKEFVKVEQTIIIANEMPLLHAPPLQTLQTIVKEILQQNVNNFKALNPKQSDWPIYFYQANNSAMHKTQKVFVYDFNEKKWSENDTLYNQMWYYINNGILAQLILWRTTKKLDDLSIDAYNNVLAMLNDPVKEKHFESVIKTTLFQMLHSTPVA